MNASCSDDRAMKPLGEPTDVLAFGARRAVDEVGGALQRDVRQRRNQFLLRKTRFEQVFWSDDRSQSVANGMHGHKEMVEAVASLHDLMVDFDKIEPSLPLTGTRRSGDQAMTHDIGRLPDR